jgi:hypothetical protein
MIAAEYGGQYSIRLNQRNLNNLPAVVVIITCRFACSLIHTGQADRDLFDGSYKRGKKQSSQAGRSAEQQRNMVGSR